jgi:hypothetical protein
VGPQALFERLLSDSEAKILRNMAFESYSRNDILRQIVQSSSITQHLLPQRSFRLLQSLLGSREVSSDRAADKVV